MNIAVLMTCHNRKATTLRCLDALACAAREVKSKSEEGRSAEFHVFLVDDGSTDGTSEAVREYADQVKVKGQGQERWEVHLIQGNGKLYWARGMALAWREALKYESTHHSSTSTFDFDSFLWLNDDTILRPDSLSALLHLYTAKPYSVLVGSLVDEVTGNKTCGVKEDGLFTGNFVLIPRSVYERVGMICDGFHHAWADSDYAMRCRRAGVKVVELENVGTTRAHDLRPTLKGVPLIGRVRLLFDPKGWCVHDLWLYRRRNWGVVTGICSALHLIVHVIKGDGE